MPSPAGCHRPACSLNGYEESNGGRSPIRSTMTSPQSPWAPDAADILNAVVVFIEYRLAPERAYPTQTQDFYPGLV